MYIGILPDIFYRREPLLWDLSLLSEGFRQEPDQAFPCLKLAFEALSRGGRAPAILNAANEVAVAAFLDGRIGFLQIAEIIEATLNAIENGPVRDLDDVFAADVVARGFAESCVAGCP